MFQFAKSVLSDMFVADSDAPPGTHDPRGGSQGADLTTLLRPLNPRSRPHTSTYCPSAPV